jgi:hypothetical protein
MHHSGNAADLGIDVSNNTLPGCFEPPSLIEFQLETSEALLSVGDVAFECPYV